MTNRIIRNPENNIARYEYGDLVFNAPVPPEDGPSRAIYDKMIAEGVTVQDYVPPSQPK